MKFRFCSTPAILVTVLALLALLAIAALHARPSTEAVRLRNALLWDNAQPADFEWSPKDVPSSYAIDGPGQQALFDQVATELQLSSASDDWARALLIAHHLLANDRTGRAAMDDLAGTYRKILAGGGYCADYTTTFIAIARSAGMFVREWAFSFDGYGGHGHAFVEVFDRNAGSWRFLDVFNNFFVVNRATGQPLTALAFRDHLRGAKLDIQIVKAAGGRLGFRDEAALMRYYHEGADQWYLWWGNAVVHYDNSLATRVLGRVSRSAEQLGAIATGVHPRIRALKSASNLGMQQQMATLKWKLLALFAGAFGLATALILQLRQRWSMRPAGSSIV